MNVQNLEDKKENQAEDGTLKFEVVFETEENTKTPESEQKKVP
jgi:hypothetical protein